MVRRAGKRKQWRKFGRKPVAKMVKAIVKKQIRSALETKVNWYPLVNVNLSGGANSRGFKIINLLSSIVEGTGEIGERIGNQLYVTSLSARLTFKLGAESEEALCRYVIFKDKQSNRNTDLSLVTEITTPTFGQLMIADNSSYPYGSDYTITNIFLDTSRYEVMEDRVFALQAKTVEQGEDVEARSGIHKNVVINIPVKERVTYDDTIAWPVKNDIYIMFLTNNYETEIPNVSGMIRINYKDA